MRWVLLPLAEPHPWLLWVQSSLVPGPAAMLALQAQRRTRSLHVTLTVWQQGSF